MISDYADEPYVGNAERKRLAAAAHNAEYERRKQLEGKPKPRSKTKTRANVLAAYLTMLAGSTLQAPTERRDRP